MLNISTKGFLLAQRLSMKIRPLEIWRRQKYDNLKKNRKAPLKKLWRIEIWENYHKIDAQHLFTRIFTCAEAVYENSSPKNLAKANI